MDKFVYSNVYLGILESKVYIFRESIALELFQILQLYSWGWTYSSLLYSNRREISRGYYHNRDKFQIVIFQRTTIPSSTTN